MLSRRALVVFLPLVAMIGGCCLPGGTPPTPQVVQESEPNDTEVQANALPLAPDSFAGMLPALTDAVADDYWTYTPSQAGVLSVEVVSCSPIVDLRLYTASDAGDLAQCAPVSLALDAQEQAFLSLNAVTPGPTYELRATFAPGP